MAEQEEVTSFHANHCIECLLEEAEKRGYISSEDIEKWMVVSKMEGMPTEMADKWQAVLSYQNPEMWRDLFKKMLQGEIHDGKFRSPMFSLLVYKKDSPDELETFFLMSNDQWLQWLKEEFENGVMTTYDDNLQQVGPPVLNVVVTKATRYYFDVSLEFPRLHTTDIFELCPVTGEFYRKMYDFEEKKLTTKLATNGQVQMYLLD